MSDSSDTNLPFPASLLRVAVVVKKTEVAALLWSWLYFFCLMAGYYILRPIRDEMGAMNGAKDLPWMYAGTFTAMLLLVPVFSTLVSKFPRTVFIPVVYHFFALNLLVFYLLLKFVPEEHLFPVAVAFFIWVSVFNLFAISIFWGFMADIFNTDEGKRLFGFIAFGASTGGICGPLLVAMMAKEWGNNPFLLFSIVLLELAIFCVYKLRSVSDKLEKERKGKQTQTTSSNAIISGGVFTGFLLVLKSPYLLGIVGYVFFHTVTGTVLYFQQADLVYSLFESRDERLQFFAKLDLIVNILALLVQCFVAGRVIKAIGVGFTLMILPLVAAFGFAAMGITQISTDGISNVTWFGAAPILTVFVVFQVLRRASNYSLSRPAREVLYTVVSREEKYKAKSFIDTAVYRGGDLLTGVSYAGLSLLGLGLGAIALGTVPLALAWAGLGYVLGRSQHKRLMKDNQEAVPCKQCGYDLRLISSKYCPECRASRSED